MGTDPELQVKGRMQSSNLTHDPSNSDSLLIPCFAEPAAWAALCNAMRSSRSPYVSQ